MHRRTRATGVLALVFGLVVATPTRARGQDRSESWTLHELEELALAQNPTLAQADAAVRAAAGRTLQAGLYPNPVMGYAGEELSLRALSKTSEHLFFMEQAIVTAGKLKYSRGIFAQAQAQEEANKEAQALRVLNSVRVLYYDALGAQEMVELRRSLAEIAQAGETTTLQLFNVGAADRPDVLEAEIERQRSELDLAEAENDLLRTWQMLAAAVGDPSLPRAPLEGDLEAEIPEIDPSAALERLLRESPEIKRARAGVEQARATLRRAKVEPVPDVLLRGGIGYNLEHSALLGGPVGPEAFVEVGVRVPLFDRNQGSIAAAEAETRRAEREITRLELELRSRLATTYDRYLDSLGRVKRYRSGILPRAQEAYDLYLARFREMGAAYPQVLIAQRTLFQARVEYVRALVEVHQSAVLLRGMLLAGGLERPGHERVMTRGSAP